MDLKAERQQRDHEEMLKKKVLEPFVQFLFYALYRRRQRKERSVRERNRRLRDNTIMKEVMSMLLFADPSL